ncbi:unnamed protein product [Coccothraustes coccothraustes]
MPGSAPGPAAPPKDALGMQSPPRCLHSGPQSCAGLRGLPAGQGALLTRRGGNPAPSIPRAPLDLADTLEGTPPRAPLHPAPLRVTAGFLSSECCLPLLKAKPGKAKRARTTFSSEQLARQQYLVGQERCLLASSLRLTEEQVKVWFSKTRGSSGGNKAWDSNKPNWPEWVWGPQRGAQTHRGTTRRTRTAQQSQGTARRTRPCPLAQGQPRHRL